MVLAFLSKIAHVPNPLSPEQAAFLTLGSADLIRRLKHAGNAGSAQAAHIIDRRQRSEQSLRIIPLTLPSRMVLLLVHVFMYLATTCISRLALRFESSGVAS